MKYSQQGTREFVYFLYEEVTIDNIKEACEQHFKETRQCDVLASDQGSSCSRMDKLSSTKMFYIRFLKSKHNFPPKHLSVENYYHYLSLPPKIARHEKPVSTNVIPAGSQRIGQSVLPKSLSVLDMMKLGKLVRKNTTVERYVAETFDVTDKSWWCHFDVDDEMVGEGCFRKAFQARSCHALFKGKTWILNKYKETSVETIHQVGDYIDGQTRKCVQMHSLAQSLATMFFFEINSIFENFSNSFCDHKAFFGKSSQQWVTIEEYIDGQFEKIINNIGVVSCLDEQLRRKAEAFAGLPLGIHFIVLFQGW